MIAFLLVIPQIIFAARPTPSTSRVDGVAVTRDIAAAPNVIRLRKERTPTHGAFLELIVEPVTVTMIPVAAPASAMQSGTRVRAGQAPKSISLAVDLIRIWAVRVALKI